MQANNVNTTITLPIAYEIAHFAVVTSTTDSHGVGGLYTSNGCDRTLTNFRFACEATGGRLCCWISCGAQQWGFIPETSSSGNTRSQTLSISFTNTNYVVCREMNSTNTGTSSAVYVNSFGIISREATSFSFRYPSHNAAYSGRFIALGFQQWGFSLQSFTSYSQAISFPISFNQICSCMVSGGNYGDYYTNDWQPAGQIKITEVSNSGFVTPFSGPKWFMCVGVQQWGLKTGTNNNNPVSLVISCNSILCAFVTAYGSHVEHGGSTANYTNNSMYVYVGGGGYVKWIAVCVQQWGRTSSSIGPTEKYQINYHVALSGVPYAIQMTTERSADSGNGWNYCHSITSTYMKVVLAEGYGRWSIIGKV